MVFERHFNLIFFIDQDNSFSITRCILPFYRGFRNVCFSATKISSYSYPPSVGGVVVIIYTKDKIVSYKRDVHGRIYMPETILSIFILIFRKRSCIQIEISKLLVSSYGDDNEDSNNMNFIFFKSYLYWIFVKKIRTIWC